MTTNDDRAPDKDAVTDEQDTAAHSEEQSTEGVRSSCDGSGQSDDAGGGSSPCKEVEATPSSSREESPNTGADECAPAAVTGGEDIGTTETAADLIPDNKQASWLVRISIKNPFSMGLR